MSKSLAQTNKSSARRPEQIDDQHEAALGGLDQGEFTKGRELVPKGSQEKAKRLVARSEAS